MYKTILVHIDETAGSLQRTEAATRLALVNQSHLVGVAMTGLASYTIAVGNFDIGIQAVGLPIKQLRAQANRALATFEDAAHAAGMFAVERRCEDEEAGVGICLSARYCDLVVISQNDRNQFPSRPPADFPAYVVRYSPQPVLVLPVAGVGSTLGERVTVAWDGSAQASRAIASALPTLQRAQRVDLVVFDADIASARHGEEPGADIALYLARQGVQVELSLEVAAPDQEQALLAFARHQQSDLIVMGAYGRSRLHEILLGGMTRAMLESSTIPLWMVH